MESDEEDALLLLDHRGELALVLPQVLLRLLVVLCMHNLVQLSGLRLELADANDVPLDLVVDDLDRRVADLVREQKVVELAEVRVRLEDVQQVEREVDRLFEVVSQSAGDGAEQVFVLEHLLHVTVVHAQVENALERNINERKISVRKFYTYLKQLEKNGN